MTSSRVVIVGEIEQCDRPSPPEAPDAALLEALPPAIRILEVGAGSPSLARAYKQRYPKSDWTAVDPHGLAHERLNRGVDHWCHLTDVALLPQASFDLLIVNEVLGWLAEPVAVLSLLRGLAAPGARLLINAENHASLAMLERILDADLSVDTRYSPTAGQPRLQSPATIFKLMMDAGWMPSVVAGHGEPAGIGSRRATLRALVQSSGLAAGCAAIVHSFDRLIIEARLTFADAPKLAGAAQFTVVVPTNNDRQFRLNVEQSPGLREVDAKIVSLRGARSPAEAFKRSLDSTESDWVLLCHQDVYFPVGFGERLNAILAPIAAEDRAHTLLGFVGVGALRSGQGTAPSGFVIDRLQRTDHPASQQAISIDEVALVLARDTVLRIDESLGWHLWATDLCLQAICHHQVFPRIVRAPLFHNSRTGWTLPVDFGDAAHRLVAKWGDGFGAIPTLCGLIDEDFLAMHPRTTRH